MSKREFFTLALIACTSVLLKLPLILQRELPTIFGDETLYFYKARNFFHYGSYFPPAGMPDCLSFAAPLYSILLAPALLVSRESLQAYSVMLAINACAIASIVFPAYKIAAAEFPDRKWLIAAAVALSVPPAYSLALLSEALFIPLFLWCGYAYLVCLRQPRMFSHLVLGAVISLLVLTRNSGLALLAVALVVTLLSAGRRGLEVATPREFFSRSPAVLLPFFTWLAWKTWTTGRLATETQSVGLLAANLSEIEPSVSEGWRYVKIWLGQLAYLNLATLGLLTLLAMVCIGVVRRPKGRSLMWHHSRLLGLRAYFAISSLAMMFPATLLMWTRPIGPELVRYRMYGRLADMIVPVILIYSIGVLRPGRRRPARWTSTLVLAGAGGLLLSETLVPHGMNNTVISPGLGWRNALVGFGVTRPAALAVCCMFLVLILMGMRVRSWKLCAGAMALGVVVLNSRAVLDQHKVQEAAERRLMRRINEIGARGERVWYRNQDHPFSIVFFQAQFLLYQTLVPLNEESADLKDGDTLLAAGRLLSFVRPSETVEFGTAKRGTELLFEGFSTPDAEHVWTDGENAQMAFRIGRRDFDRDLRLRLRAIPFAPSALGENQFVDLYAKRSFVTRWVLSGDRTQEYTATIPRSFLGSYSELELELRFSRRVSPYDLGLSQDQRCLGLAVLALEIQP